MLATLLTTLTEALLNAQLIAIKRLAAIVESSEDPAESRRAATTLLRLKLPKLADLVPAPETPPASPHHTAPEALLPAELNTLRLIFPDKQPAHFTSSHSPAYWRNLILQRSRPQAGQPSAQPIGVQLDRGRS